MRRILIAMLIALSLMPLSADGKLDFTIMEETQEYGDLSGDAMEIAEDLSIEDFPDYDSLLAYAFVLSYDGLRQQIGDGGIAAFDDNLEAIASWKMPGTPDSFFEHLPPDTLVTPYVVPAPVAEILFLGLGDIHSARALRALDESSAVTLYTIWKIYGEVVIKDPVYALAEIGIDRRIAAHGYEPDVFYALYEEATGITEEEFVSSLMETKGDADKAIEEGMSLIKEYSTVAEDRRPVLILLAVLGVLLVMVLVAGIMIFVQSRKTESDPDGYNHYEGEPDKENTEGSAGEKEHGTEYGQDTERRTRDHQDD